MSIGIHILVSVIILGLMYMLYNKLNKKHIKLEKKVENISLLMRTNHQLNHTETFEPNINMTVTPVVPKLNIAPVANKQPYNSEQNINDVRKDKLVENFNQKTSDINNLKNEINNIQNMLSDSSEDFEDLNAEEYQNNLNTEIEPIDNNLIDQINKTEAGINIDSEENKYDHLLYSEAQNNSELGLILNKHPPESDTTQLHGAMDIKTIDDDIPVSNIDDTLVDNIDDKKADIHSYIQDETPIDVNNDINFNVVDVKSDSGLDSMGADGGDETSMSSNILLNKASHVISGTDSKDIEINVLSNNYTKKQLLNFCENNNVSKRGNKKQLVERLKNNGFKFKDISNTLEK